MSFLHVQHFCFSALILIFGSGLSARAQNLLTNGSFENFTVAQGVNGSFQFSNNYNEDFNGTLNTGNLRIVTNASSGGGAFATFADNTNGSGNMLLVNGENSNNQYPWAQSVSLLSATNYRFSFFARNANSSDNVDPRIQLYFGTGTTPNIGTGSTLGSELSLTEVAGWQSRQVDFTVGSSGNYWFALVDVPTDTNGNNFALDDLTLTVVPEASTWITGAVISLLVVAAVRRRQTVLS